jgi:hypothetical protein
MRVAATRLSLALLDGCGGSDFDHSARTDKAVALQIDVAHGGASGGAAAAAPTSGLHALDRAPARDTPTASRRVP